MKAYIIYLSHRPHSNIHANLMFSQLTDFNFDVHLFDGTRAEDANIIFEKENRKLYPYSIKSRYLDREEISELLKKDLPEEFWETYNVSIQEKFKWDQNQILKHSNGGTKGCFHSHYRLWKLCVKMDEPIAIFEDDVKFFRRYEPVEFKDVLILSLGKRTFEQNPYKDYLENPKGTPAAVEWPNFSMPGASGYILKPRAAKSLVKFYKNYYMPADNAINKNLVNIEIHNYLMGRNTLKSEGNISDRKSRDM